MRPLRRAIRVVGVVLAGAILAACSSTTGGTALMGPGGTAPGGGGTAASTSEGTVIPPVPIGSGASTTAQTAPSARTVTSSPQAATSAKGSKAPGSTTATSPLSHPTIGGQTPTGSGGSGATAGPPSWVAAGIRISYYAAAASVAASTFAWVEDPSGPWVDPATGTHYRRTDETGEGMATASGDGVSQFDIMAVEADGVVVTNTLYGIDHTTGNLAVGATVGGTVTGPVLDGVWINPATLDALKASPPAGILVLIGPYPLGGKTYQAISFATTDPKAYQAYTYDTATGLLLVATTSTAGATSPLAAPGENPPQGNTQLTSTVLAGVRQRTVPGMNGTNPSWVPDHRQLGYTGTYNFTNPVDPSSANLTYPMTLNVTLKPGTSSWVPYTATALIQMPGAQQTQAASVTGPSGLYWIDPAALSKLSAGQVLDTDPLTGEKYAVAAADGSSVTLTQTLPGIANAARYDTSSGVLAQFQQKQNESGSTISLQLTTY